jgi:predicted GIY-YIG superfamily endonuclease
MAQSKLDRSIEEVLDAIDRRPNRKVMSLSYTTKELIRNVERGIIVNAEYNRDAVWSVSMQKEFIEAWMEDLCVGCMYFRSSGSADGGNLVYNVLDGWNRTQAMVQFTQGAFPVTLGGCSFYFKEPNDPKAARKRPRDGHHILNDVYKDRLFYERVIKVDVLDHVTEDEAYMMMNGHNKATPMQKGELLRTITGTPASTVVNEAYEPFRPMDKLAKIYVICVDALERCTHETMSSKPVRMRAAALESFLKDTEAISNDVRATYMGLMAQVYDIVQGLDDVQGKMRAVVPILCGMDPDTRKNPSTVGVVREQVAPLKRILVEDVQAIVRQVEETTTPPQEYVYVIEGVMRGKPGYYYVGHSTDPERQFNEHVSGMVEATKYLRDIKRISTTQVPKGKDEKAMETSVTLQYMRDKGIDYVRGGDWTEMWVTESIKVESILRAAAKRMKLCKRCGRGDHLYESCVAREYAPWLNIYTPVPAKATPARQWPIRHNNMA